MDRNQRLPLPTRIDCCTIDGVDGAAVSFRMAATQVPLGREGVSLLAGQPKVGPTRQRRYPIRGDHYSRTYLLSFLLLGKQAHLRKLTEREKLPFRNADHAFNTGLIGLPTGEVAKPKLGPRAPSNTASASERVRFKEERARG